MLGQQEGNPLPSSDDEVMKLVVEVRKAMDWIATGIDNGRDSA